MSKMNIAAFKGVGWQSMRGMPMNMNFLAGIRAGAPREEFWVLSDQG